MLAMIFSLASGRVLARRLALPARLCGVPEGCAVVLTARRPEQLEKLRGDLADEGAEVHVVPADLSERTVDAILAVVDAEQQPRRPLLSAAAYDLATATYRDRLSTWADWEQVTRSAG
jgi:NADP-dependent 3-hydroxy acid dehydrogenase YdfG